MSGRNYDFILNVANTSDFVASNIVIGISSQTTGLVVNVDHAASTLKVKLANVNQEFITGETLISNGSVFVQACVSASYSNASVINGTTNTFSLPTSNLTNFYLDSINVYFNGFLVPKQTWVYPGLSGANSITIKPITFTKTTATDQANLQAKASSVIKENFFSQSAWQPGTSTSDITLSPDYASSIVTNYSRILPDTDLNGIFVGSDTSSNFSYKLPTANTANLTVSIAYGEVNSTPFFPGYKTGEIETANTTITSIGYSKFIAAKNTFEQQPLVRLYTLYYPGEWYPSRVSGNPNTEQMDVQYPWPNGFPVRFAEIRGDYVSDITYRVQSGGVEYMPYPINSTGISLDSSGKINDVSFIVSNFDGLITQLVENAYLCGYNEQNNSPATVNGETCFNIDPRTNPSNVHFDSAYSDQVGINVAWTYSSTNAIGDTWVPLKQDTRDMLGGIIEIRTTFADLLDYWPEYSSVIEKGSSNYLKMRTTSPYRVGDVVHNDGNNMANASSTIIQLQHPYVVVDNGIHLNPGDNLYIQNPNTSSDEFVLDTFKINNLEGLDETAARFSLTSWLQYFKNVLPRRSFLKNSCVWAYKGDECQYPSSGTGAIPGSSKTANGFFTINNATTPTASLDVCAKNLTACRLRRNEIHFSSFPGTGVSVPR